ncbi:MAG: hypothetical protein J6O00_03130 [Clostridiales bacterium]|nr:hypothetical protein [Clostridiales bacterium]
MTSLLYKLIEIITLIHEKILSWNDSYEYNFTDKQLHFIVVGILGMGLLLLIHPFFKFLAQKKLTLVISWIYVVTLLLALTFSIEIGQRITKTGYMDFRDIMYGMGGFFLLFGMFYAVRLVIKLIVKLFRDEEPSSSPSKS